MSKSILSGILLLIYNGYYLINFLISNFYTIIHFILNYKWIAYNLIYFLWYATMIVLAFMLFAKKPKKSLGIFWLLNFIMYLLLQIMIFVMYQLKVFYGKFTITIPIVLMLLIPLLMYINHLLNKEHVKFTWFIPSVLVLIWFVYLVVRYAKNGTLASWDTLLWVILALIRMAGTTLYGYCLGFDQFAVPKEKRTVPSGMRTQPAGVPAAGPYSAPAEPAPVYSAPVQQPAPMTANINVADELMKYKELMDAGVITREEFNTVKGRLLGMKPEETEEQKIADALKF